MTSEALKQAKNAYLIESECIKQMLEYFDEEAFSKAVELLKNAERIGAAGCGHSGIICQHFCHLMCCIERPARFISPAEAVHGGTGFLQEGDVMVFASRGGKTKELLPILDICKKNLDSYLDLGIDKVNKLLLSDTTQTNSITESLFFYPIVGMLNNLTKELYELDVNS